MTKLSDFVVDYLVKHGINKTFMLSGGGIMHLVESVGSNRKMEYICCQHEQGAAIASQAYNMCKNNLSVCLVTTGPGGTNALTATGAAYMDSTPMLFISGQVKRSDFASLRNVRQFGAQENDIVSMAKPVTKYAITVEKPEDILYVLHKAVYTAMSPRRGPVWLDIPLDIQAAMIDETALRDFAPNTETEQVDDNTLEKLVKDTYGMLNQAKRPLILIGHGLVASEAQELFRELQKRLGVPVIATWRALDVYDSLDECFLGSPGLQATRYSNITTQGCDLLLVLGSRLDNMITAFSESHFAFRAKKIIVDIDKNEMAKLDMPEKTEILSDVHRFVKKMLDFAELYSKPDISKWLGFCTNIKQRFPLLNEKQTAPCKFVDLYKATTVVSENCNASDVIVVSSTSRCNTAGHIAFNHKRGQKVISSMGFGSMGFALPSVVGAGFAAKNAHIVMIEGDGSFQLNIQELQTIKYYNINAKMFVFTNHGYAAIATMQDRNFNGHHVGCTYESGVSMPDLRKISDAYGFEYFAADSNSNIEETVKKTMQHDGAAICEIFGDITFDEIPKCISSVDENGKRVSAALENPFPFLSEKEMNEIYSEII